MPDHIKPVPDPEPQKPRRRWPLYLLAVLIVLALTIVSRKKREVRTVEPI